MSDAVDRLNGALEGRYRIERELGEGGMATVYLADDLRHGRKVAIKTLKPELAAAIGADRFLAEIRTTARLQHPNILPLFDSGDADGLLFYVMPHVEGETLRDRLDGEGQLPLDEALRIGREIAEALQAAHRKGILHRDIKPANVLLSGGHAVVSDFGIALDVGADPGDGARLTRAGASLGTPRYMSPEQAAGDPVGASSDVYALGCVVYEMLSGEAPFVGPTLQALLAKKLTEEPTSLRALRAAVPEAVELAVRNALRPRPADRPESAAAFAREFTAAEGGQAQSPVRSGPKNNLPQALDSFVGREEELGEIVDAFQSARLVTLTGVGGTGKTRLSLAAAEQLLTKFPSGVWFVELASVLHEDSVPHAVADVLGIRQREGKSMIESIVLGLEHHSTLLVLDNCEHVLDTVAGMALEIVAHCPGARVLATSREGLAVRGEHLLALGSLPEDEATKLFTDRARAAGATGELDQETLRRLCRRLDGIPLAIELAAARCRTMAPEQIESRLDDRFRLLRGSRRGRTERHQTLRNAVAWSYDLLEPVEQAIFDRLSVFAGGFELDAAVVVAGGDELDPLDIEDSITSLVDRSMVLASPTEHGTRYRLLETLRQFGEDRLIQTGDGEAVQDRHLGWVLDFMRRADAGIHGTDDVYWAHALRREFENVRAAFYHAIDSGDGRSVDRILHSFGMWTLWTHRLETGDWAADSLELDPEPEIARAYAAWHYAISGRLEEAHAIAAWSDIPEGEESMDAYVTMLARWGYTMYSADPSFTEYVERTIAIGRRAAIYPSRLAFHEAVRTQFHLMAGNVDEARRAAEKGLAVASELGNTELLAWCHYFMGRPFPDADPAESHRHLQRAIDLSRSLGYVFVEGLAVSEAATLAVQTRETADALAHFVSVCQRFIDVGDMLSLWTAVHQLVFLLLRRDRTDEASGVWFELGTRQGFAPKHRRDELNEIMGPPPPPQLSDQAFILQIRGLLDTLG